MRLSILAAAALLSPLVFVQAEANPAPSNSDLFSAALVIRELNLARQNPSFSATFVAESRPFFMIEHGRPVDEAVRFLNKAHPLPPLTLSAGMSHAAADH